MWRRQLFTIILKRAGAEVKRDKHILWIDPGRKTTGLAIVSRLTRVIDLFARDGILGNVPAIILTEAGDFQFVGRAGDPWDIPVTGGQGFILTAQQPATVTISGEAWTNTSGSAAASSFQRHGYRII